MCNGVNGTSAFNLTGHHGLLVRINTDQESSGSATRLHWHRMEVDVESEAVCSVVPGLEVVCSAKHAADEVELSGHA